MSTEQLPACVLHAHFEAAVLHWQLRRGDKVIDAGRIAAITTDPLPELRRLEIRAGATVRMKEAELTPPEISYARAQGWELV